MKRKVSKHKILKIASKYLNELNNIITEKEKKRGRPKKYDDKIIIFALILKVVSTVAKKHTQSLTTADFRELPLDFVLLFEGLFREIPNGTTEPSSLPAFSK